MRRRAWLILSVAALFGLRTPICVVACLEAGGPGSAVAAAHASAEAAPCHGAAPVAPERQPAGDHECDCERARLVVAKSDAENAFPSLELRSPALAPGWPVGTGAPARAAAPERHNRALPPPDILLLTSTLLL